MNRKALNNITNVPGVANPGKENRPVSNSRSDPPSRPSSAERATQNSAHPPTSASSVSSNSSGMVREIPQQPAPVLVENQQQLYDSVPRYVVPDDEQREDIDINDLNNEYAVAIYAEDVYKYLKEMEFKYRPMPDYMSHQEHITPRLRAYCVDWLVEMHKHLSQAFEKPLQLDTLFLSISILDRFLARKSIAADRLHLVGLGAFYIASKFEETYYPSIDQLLRFAPEIMRKDDVIRIERIILNELRFVLGVPTSICFLKRYAKVAHADPMIGMLSRFMTEYAMSSYSISTNFLPSQIAAAATAHALRIVNRHPWTATLQYYTGYTYEELRPVLVELKDAVKKAPTLKTQAIYKKYADNKYLRAAVIAVQKI